VIRRQQALSLSLCFATNDTWRRWWQAPHDDKFGACCHLLLQKTQQQNVGLLSSYLAKDDNELQPIVVFLCFVHYLQMMMMSQGFIVVSFIFSIPTENDVEPMLVIIFFCFVYVHLEKMMTSQCSLSSFFILFLCTQRRWRWVSSCHIFLFCFCAPRKDDDDLVFIIVFFCFLSMHLEKTMTSWCSSSFFFLLFLSI